MTENVTCEGKNNRYYPLDVIDYSQLFIVGLFLFIGMADFRYGFENYILAGLLALWMTMLFLFRQKHFNKVLIRARYVSLAIFSVFYILPQFILSISIADIFKGYVAFILVIAPFIFADYYYNKLGKTLFIKISMIIMGYCMFFSVRTIHVLINNPKAARYLTYGSSATNIDRMNQFGGIGGGYDLAYALVLLVPVLLHCIIQKDGLCNRKKGIFTVAAILFTYTIVLSDFGMAFLLLVIGVFGIILSLINDKSRLAVASIIILLVLLSFLYKDGLGNFLIQFGGLNMNDTIGSRITIIGYYLRGDIQLWDISLRITRNIESIRTFMAYPFLGASIDALYDVPMLRDMYIGNHSDFLDVLAKYGLLAGGPMIAFYVFALRSIRKNLEKYSKDRMLATSNILFLLIAVLNYVSVISISATVAWIIPGIVLMSNEYNNRLPKEHF